MKKVMRKLMLLTVLLSLVTSMSAQITIEVDTLIHISAPDSTNGQAVITWTTGDYWSPPITFKLTHLSTSEVVISYKSSGTVFSGSHNETFSKLKVGEYEFQLTDSKFPWANNPTIKFIIEDYTPGVGIETGSFDISVYPNPCKDRLFVKGFEGEINIINSTGAIQMSIPSYDGDFVDVSELETGYYILIIKSLNDLVTVPMLKVY